MPSRQARPSRRRAVAPSQLPRPAASTAPLPKDVSAPAPARQSAVPTSQRQAPARRPLGVRAHHVTEDYRYVRSDLVLVAAVSAVTLAFVIGMSFWV
jgi:hypothetical protein